MPSLDGCRVHNSSDLEPASRSAAGTADRDPSHDVEELCTPPAHESGRGDRAAWRAAPSATYSPGAGTSTGTPSTSGAMTRTASDCAPPPISSARSSGTPRARSASRPAPSPPSMPSTAARARFSRVVEARVMPVSDAVASGRFGVRSPSKYGTSDEAVRTGLGGEREPAELGVVDTEQAARSRRARGRR